MPLIDASPRHLALIHFLSSFFFLYSPTLNGPTFFSHADQRLIRFGATVSDRPGGIARLAKDMAEMGVSIKVKAGV